MTAFLYGSKSSVVMEGFELEVELAIRKWLVQTNQKALVKVLYHFNHKITNTRWKVYGVNGILIRKSLTNFAGRRSSKQYYDISLTNHSTKDGRTYASSSLVVKRVPTSWKSMEGILSQLRTQNGSQEMADVLGL